MLYLLVITTVERQHFFDRLLAEIERLKPSLKLSVQLLYNDGSITIGTARNKLLEQAYELAKKKGNLHECYSAFFDDDDLPTEHYFSEIEKGIKMGVDVVSLKGIYTVNGQNPEIFEHSLQYNQWLTNEGVKYPNVKYERPPNHLNAMKLSIAHKFTFPDINHGEDKAWSMKISECKVLQTEHYVLEPIYRYLKRT
jgi:hypothetical protein